MLIATLTIIAKNWKHHQCPLTGERRNKLQYMHTVEHYSANGWIFNALHTGEEARFKRRHTVSVHVHGFMEEAELWR